MTLYVCLGQISHPTSITEGKRNPIISKEQNTFFYNSEGKLKCVENPHLSPQSPYCWQLLTEVWVGRCKGERREWEIYGQTGLRNWSKGDQVQYKNVQCLDWNQRDSNEWRLQTCFPHVESGTILAVFYSCFVMPTVTSIEMATQRAYWPFISKRAAGREVLVKSKKFRRTQTGCQSYGIHLT